MSCLFEPIHGRFHTNSICDSYPDCVGCSYSDPFKQPKQTNADRIRAMTDEAHFRKLYVRNMICIYDEAFTINEMLEETGRCKDCKFDCPNAGKQMDD